MKGLLLGLASLSAMAQSLEDLVLASSPAPDVILKFGGQADSTQGHGYQGKVTWNPSKALTLFLSGEKSNLAAAQPVPSSDGNTSTTASLGGGVFWGALFLGLQYEHSELSDLLTSRRYTFQPLLEKGNWRFGLEFSARTTDFDRLQFNNLILNTPNGPLFITGYADLNLSDTGLGGTCEYEGDTWRFYGAYTHYDYGSFEGNTNVSRLRNSSGTVSTEVFRAISGRWADRVERMSASRLSRGAALLDATATAGIEANLLFTRWGVEANQDTDHLTGQRSNTFTGIAGWKATLRFTLELHLGTTHSEALGTNQFAGLSFIYRTRPGF